MDLSKYMSRFVRPYMGRRVFALTVSIAAMGLGISLFNLIGFGTDPCSTFNLGVSQRIGLSFGTWQLIFNALIAVPVAFADISRFGLGTLFNMVGVGYVADFFLFVLKPLVPENGLSMSARVLLFCVTSLVFLAAASTYMVVDLGVSPYDAAPQLLAMRLKRLSFRAVRVLWDVAMLTIGFLLGATVGPTTLIIGFCLGPAITFVSNHMKRWFE